MIAYSALTYPLAFILLSLGIIFLSRKKPSEWIGENPSRKHLLPLFFIFIQLLIIGIGIDVISSYLGVNDTQNVNGAIESLNENPPIALLSLGLGALGEEMFFRGILQTLWGPFVSSLLFGLFHAGYDSFIQIIGSFLAGLVLARTRMTSGSIFPGVGGHLLYNLVIVFVLGG
jgi:membrane protease YdiL (CAAX protease family)